MEKKEQVDKECSQMKRGEGEEKGKRGGRKESVINVVDCSALSNLSNKLLTKTLLNLDFTMLHFPRRCL